MQTREDAMDWMGLAHHIIRRHYQWAVDRGVEYDALLSAGWEGARHACARFDPQYENHVTFVSRSIHSKIYDYLNTCEFHFRRRIRPEFVALSPADEDVQSSPSGEREMLARIAIERLLPLLSPRHREVVQRHDLKGETLFEIADDWGVTFTAVGHMRTRALRVLRTHLEGIGHVS